MTRNDTKWLLVQLERGWHVDTVKKGRKTYGEKIGRPKKKKDK